MKVYAEMEMKLSTSYYPNSEYSIKRMEMKNIQPKGHIFSISTFSKN